VSVYTGLVTWTGSKERTLFSKSDDCNGRTVDVTAGK